MTATSSTPLRLRPLGLGQILDQAIRLYRRNFLKFIGIFAVVQVPVTLLTIIVSAQTSQNLMQYFLQASEQSTFDEAFWPRYIGGVSLALLLSLVGFVLIQVFGAGALTQAITDNLLGKPVNILNAYDRIGSVWLRLLVTALVFGLVYVGAVLWTIIVPCVGWLTGPSLLAFLTMVIGPLLTPIVILEGKTSGQAIRRAWDLARRRFWPLVGFALVLAIFAQFMVTGPVVLARSLILAMLGPAVDLENLPVWQSIIESIVALFTNLLYSPLQLSAVTLMYYDLRVRNEGLDLALLAGEASSQASETPMDFNDLVAHSPAAEVGPLLERKDFANFAIISVVIGSLYTLLMLGFLFLAMIVFAASESGAGF